MIILLQSKLFKSYLGSSLGQEKLSNMTLLSFENKVSRRVDFENIVDEFAAFRAGATHPSFCLKLGCGLAGTVSTSRVAAVVSFRSPSEITVGN